MNCNHTKPRGNIGPCNICKEETSQADVVVSIFDDIPFDDGKAFPEIVAGVAPQESTTGSLRFNSGKPISNEISPGFILGIGEVMEKSRAKYPRGNWAKGNDFSVPYDSAMRHLLAFQSGQELDSETGAHHLLHAATNLMFLYYYSQNFPQFDDRLFKKEKK